MRIAHLPQLLLVGMEEREPSPRLRRLIRRGVGGIVLYERNCADASQVRDLTTELQGIAHEAGQPPLIIAVDQEHGPVTRIKKGVTLFPSPYKLALRGEEAVREMARVTAKELSSMGINLNLAPVADLLLTDNEVIGERSFGKNPERVAELVALYVEELQGVGVAACAKHFPGHGACKEDSHKTLPILDLSIDLLGKRELLPFREAIRVGVATMMVGHILIPALDPETPATFSPRVIRGVLREELGFRGVVISDDILMGALSPWSLEERALLALKGGIDMLLVSGEGEGEAVMEGLMRGWDGGRLPPERVRDAANRIAALKERFPWRRSHGEDRT